MCTPQTIDSALNDVRIGFLNMMPDQAIAATERQFLRLLSAHKKINCWFYPFTISGIERSNEALTHVEQFYSSLEQIKELNLHALVITGANVSQPVLTQEAFWSELEQVLLWAKENVHSTVCSCLATHAAAKVFYTVDREHLPEKCWGVFAHQVVVSSHELMQGITTPINMCHSRFNDVSADALRANDVSILIQSEEAGVQCAIDENLGMVYFQGHPEYDDISLLKEYKREVVRYAFGQREDYPPLPASYFNAEARDIAKQFQQRMSQTSDPDNLVSEFPEAALRAQLQNPWQQAAQQIFSNWLSTLPTQ